jgi:hypothetical protein
VNEQDHADYVKLTIPEIDFDQEEGKIYWLVLDADIQEELRAFGWKTSRSHFMDTAVYSTSGNSGPWTAMYDPTTGEPLDLAFVIVPEPSTLILVSLAALTVAGWRRKRR